MEGVCVMEMTDDELRTRIRNGTPIKILAELNGVSDQTIRNWMKKNNVSRPTDEELGERRPNLDPRVLDKIEIEIVELRAALQKLEDQAKELKSSLESWEYIARIAKGEKHGPST